MVHNTGKNGGKTSGTGGSDGAHTAREQVRRIVLITAKTIVVHFLFLFPTSRDPALRALLVSELRSQVSPLLQSLDFRIFRPRGDGKRGFASKYYRMLPNQIDVIDFVWMTRGEPAFIIDFDVIDHLERFPTIAKEGSAAWFNAPRYRAHSNTGQVSRWFHIGYLPRLNSPQGAARKEVEDAKSRIVEIDRFAKTGETSPYFRSNRDFEPVPMHFTLPSLLYF